MKKYLKNTNGITLIALIITVIIMLILAGVAISALTTDGGLFSKTQSAVEKYNNAVKLQDEKISSLINEMNTYFDKYSNKDVVTTDSLPPKEFEVILEDVLENSITITCETQDAEATDESTSSGIKEYIIYIKKSSETEYKELARSVNALSNYKCEGLNPGTEYNIKVVAVDNALNERESTNVIIATTDMYVLRLNGSTYIDTGIAESSFIDEFTIAIRVKINRAEQETINYMGIIGDHLQQTGFNIQFVETSSTFHAGVVDFNNYYDEWVNIILTYSELNNR